MLETDSKFLTNQYSQYKKIRVILEVTAESGSQFFCSLLSLQTFRVSVCTLVWDFVNFMVSSTYFISCVPICFVLVNFFWQEIAFCSPCC